MTSSPAALGYRMPPEWHRHSATWLAWPKDPLTWPGRVAAVEATFLHMIAALAAHETVRLLVDDEASESRVKAQLPGAAAHRVRFHRIRTVDSWIRDYGPNFIVDASGRLAYNHWQFNAWGEKYAELKADQSVCSLLEPVLGVPRFEPGIVLEGGSIEVDGAGVCMTTEQCLLNPNRNPGLDRNAIEHKLRDHLGIRKVLWLGCGIEGDDTDGHVDDLARFVSPDTVVCARQPDPADANHEVLEDNLRRLELATNAQGRKYSIVTLPMPSAVEAEGGPLPASYANFYIGNGVVLTPVFGETSDRVALETLQTLFPDRSVIGIDCRDLVWGMGAIHCVTQQQPLASGWYTDEPDSA